MKTVTLLVITSILKTYAGFQPDPPSSLHAEFRDSVYNQSRDSVKVNLLLDNSINEAEKMTPELHKLYWLARTHFLIGWYYHRTFDKRELAKKHWNIMNKYTDDALEIQRFSEGFRLKAEAISHLCMVTSIPWVIINGLKIKGYCKKALDLCPENGKAMFLLGGSKTYPPVWFGGNPHEAIKLLNKALNMNYLELNDRYNVFTAMGVAYLKEKKYRHASEWLEKALLIYPGNEFSQSMILQAQLKNEIDLKKYYPPDAENQHSNRLRSLATLIASLVRRLPIRTTEPVNTCRCEKPRRSLATLWGDERMLSIP